MKKTIIASTLAVGLGVAAGNAGHADASESQINKAELAQLAQSNDQSLNNSPIQQGAYNMTFDYNGFTYHFESDGSNWSWDYNQSGQTGQSSQATQQQGVSQQASTSNNQSSDKVVTSQTQTSQQQPTQTQQAPQTNQSQQPQQASTSNNTTNTASSGSSVHVNEHLQQIAQRESRGDIHAVNPSSGAAGKYQFLQSTWDTVAPDEYKGVSPAQAPESVQDATAVKLYNTEVPITLGNCLNLKQPEYFH